MVGDNLIDLTRTTLHLCSPIGRESAGQCMSSTLTFEESIQDIVRLRTPVINVEKLFVYLTYLVRSYRRNEADLNEQRE